MSSRRLKVDRTAGPETSALNKAQQMEVRRIVEESLRELQDEHSRVRTELEAAKVYICNLSTIMRDMGNSVLLAKYSSGSTKAVLSELVQLLELSLQNAQYLPPQYSGMADWQVAPLASSGSPVTSGPAYDYGDIPVYVPRRDEDDDLPDDPVASVSDF